MMTYLVFMGGFLFGFFLAALFRVADDSENF